MYNVALSCINEICAAHTAYAVLYTEKTDDLQEVVTYFFDSKLVLVQDTIYAILMIVFEIIRTRV